jgi:3-methyladenine DNA glycosylase AlkD
VRRVPLIDTLRPALVEAADPARAPAMAAYMKSAMPFHGVAKPILAALLKGLLSAHPLPDAVTWRADVLGLWRAARFREERYAALALSRDRRAKGFHDMDALPMYEDMIVTGAWWDYVDEIAAHCLGLLLEKHPKPMRAAMLSWSTGPDMWKRRSSILCQLRFKARTDRAMLYACIEPSIGSKEFFLRKAIGWALRAYAYAEPDEVRRYVAEHEARLSGLSRREALKNLG